MILILRYFKLEFELEHIIGINNLIVSLKY